MDTQENVTGRGWGVCPPAIERILGAMAVILLIGLISLTSVDVVARYFFNAPVRGAFELTQMMLAALIFVALPLTTASGEHVEVDLLAVFFGRRLEILIFIIGQLISALVLAVLAWRIGAYAWKLAEDGAVSDSLNLPIAPVGYFAAIACALSGILAIMRIRQEWSFHREANH